MENLAFERFEPYYDEILKSEDAEFLARVKAVAPFGMVRYRIAERITQLTQTFVPAWPNCYPEDAS